MKVPKYVQELIKGFDFETSIPEYNPGYTIRVYKPSVYMKIPVFENKIKKLIKWASENYAEAHIDYVPEKTHYCKQFIRVTITDPVMQQLEKYR